MQKRAVRLKSLLHRRGKQKWKKNEFVKATSKQFGRSIEKNLEMGKQRSRAPVHRPTR